MFVYFQFTLSSFGAYTIVLMTFDRFCAIVYPHITKMQCTKKKVIQSTCLNILVVSLFYVPLIFITEKAETTSKSFCSKYLYQDWYIQLYSVLQIIIYPAVAVIALFCMNISIIVSLKKSNVTSTMSEETRRGQQRQVTMMLLLVSFTFMLLLLPFEIRNLVLILYKPEKTVAEVAKGVFIFQLTFEMMMFNHVINFYLYLISGSKFRNDLKTLCCCGGNSEQTSADRSGSSEMTTGSGGNQKTDTDVSENNAWI